MATLLVHICPIKYSFIDEELMERVYEIPEIKLQYLIKPKQIWWFDDSVRKTIIQTIYLTKSDQFLKIDNIE